jgi:SAM-dependent methyltransferase
MRTLRRAMTLARRFSPWKQAKKSEPRAEFQSWHYMRHNQRRQEHLASLELPIAGRSVLEIGAGIGDHTSFFLDRGCTVIVTEGRDENLRFLAERFPTLDVRRLDLESPDPDFAAVVDVVYCYGTLYHVSRPAEALAFIAEQCGDLLLLETCVTPGEKEVVNQVEEDIHNPTQALSGRGCRPTRAWVLARLRAHFPFAYITRTQPWHEEYPLDWDLEPNPQVLMRSVFIASRRPIESAVLSESIPNRQRRH